MSHAQPATGPMSGWDLIDEAVRHQLSSVLGDPAASGTGGLTGPGGLSAGGAMQDLMGRVDPISLLPALARTARALAGHPRQVVGTTAHTLTALRQAAAAAVVRSIGGESAYDPQRRSDKRFADPAWSDNAGFWLTRECYQVWADGLVSLVAAADTEPEVRAKAEFAVQLLIDTLAPTNFAISNPAVLKRAFETGGLSWARGVRNLARDVVSNGGSPRQVATGVHVVGKNLAVTPGKVVFRNELMELIQYTPSTVQVHEIPLLFSPPWINKYYVMDLAPGRSLVQWAVDHGHTVFMISYRNPDESMRGVSMDDYLLDGPLSAIEVITEITGAPKVNLLGLCLGGTLTMASLAYLDATGYDKINSATFLNTLTDFSEPGLLGVFTDQVTVDRLERSMKRVGFLSTDNMRRTFDLMRANDLIWNYVVSSWLMGEEPPAFDLLTWNADATRMPADMHTFYLRSCYRENQLASGTMKLAGQQLDMTQVSQDLYFLAAEQDHIAPWRSSYKGALLPRGTVRFVLSNAGHIAGIVNPPNPKSIHRVVDGDTPLPADPDAWLAAATTHPETWWQDWARWIGDHAGGLRKPPRTGSRKHRPLSDAPGTYVLEQ